MEENKPRKTDYRSRYTQMVVKQTLLKLLAEKPLSKITVSEICESAALTRGTFYNHYQSVYDVSDSIEQEFYEQIIERLDNQNSYRFDEAFFKDIITLLAEHMDLLKILLDDKSNSNFIKMIVAHIHKRFAAVYAQSHPHLKSKTVDVFLTYAISGSIGIVTKWVNDVSLFSTDELAQIIGHFNRIILNTFIENDGSI